MLAVQPGLSGPGGRQAGASKCAWTRMQTTHTRRCRARTRGAVRGHRGSADVPAGQMERRGVARGRTGWAMARRGRQRAWQEKLEQRQWQWQRGLDDRVRARTSVRPSRRLAWPASRGRGGPRVVTSARRSRTWPCLLPINCETCSCKRSSHCDGRRGTSLISHAARTEGS